MLTCGGYEGSIVISTFGGDVAYSDVACLLLPPTQPDIVISMFTTHSGPFVAHAPPGRLFTTSQESRIHFFSVEYVSSRNRIIPLQFCFFVHNRTLLSYISKMAEADSTVPWEEWGPQNTRFQKQKSTFHWLRSAHRLKALGALYLTEIKIRSWPTSCVSSGGQRQTDLGL
jgi:hypothetical protein